MVVNSNSISVDDKWPMVKPFLFDDENNNIVEFEFIFITNNLKYKYNFTCDTNKIYNESLDVYNSQKPTNIFKRVNTNNYTFINTDKRELESIKTKNTENKLFLSTATNWNYEKTKDAYLWFKNTIDTYDNFNQISEKDLISYSNNDNELKEFTLNLLKESDIYIKDINVNLKEREIDSELLNFINPKLINNNYKTKDIKIELLHEVNTENGKKTYKLDFNDESEGTKILFVLAPFLKRAFEKSKIIIVDELEKGLHPLLVKYLLYIFNNKNINKVNSQLIFTSHLTYLLDLKLFRRDQIWFVDKNPDTCISDLYPLDSFSVRKDENVLRGYINGRYGGLPYINSGVIWQEENM